MQYNNSANNDQPDLFSKQILGFGRFFIAAKPHTREIGSVVDYAM